MVTTMPTAGQTPQANNAYSSHELATFIAYMDAAKEETTPDALQSLAVDRYLNDPYGYEQRGRELGARNEAINRLCASRLDRNLRETGQHPGTQAMIDAMAHVITAIGDTRPQISFDPIPIPRFDTRPTQRQDVRKAIASRLWVNNEPQTLPRLAARLMLTQGPVDYDAKKIMA
jgi:hypothetical protein